MMLVTSLLALFAGPLLYRLARSQDVVRAILDGFVFVSIAGLVLGHVLPETFERAGWWSILFALLGLFGPLLFEGRIRALARPAHATALALALTGMVVHGLIDGMALGGIGDHAHEGSHALGLAVVVHRVPVALAVWWLLRPTRGGGLATAVLVLIGVSTVGGYAFATHLAETVASRPAAFFQALVAGSLLHVIFHITPTRGHGNERRLRRAQGIGALAALAGLAALALDEHEHAPSGVLAFSDALLTLAAESAPALVLAFLGAGLIQSFLPKAGVDWMRRGGAASQAARGVAFGLPLPVCSCGVVPIYKSLIARGVPISAATAFLVATPELGIDAVLLSLPLLGPELAAARVLAAAVVALAVGWIVGRTMAKRAADAPVAGDAADPNKLTPSRRLSEALRVGFGDVVDATGPWILTGLVAGAILQPTLDADVLGSIPGGLQIPLFALLGMPLYVCASGATPLVAVLIAKGVSPGAGLAFLLTGPATNVTTFGLLNRLHGRRMALAFASSVVALTVVLSYLTDLTLGDVTTATGILHDHHEFTAVEVVAMTALALLFLGSVLRQGPRGFVARVLPWAVDHEEAACEADAPAEPKSCCGAVPVVQPEAPGGGGACCHSSSGEGSS